MGLKSYNCSSDNPLLYHLQTVQDYYPYGKTLRRFNFGELFLTTQHQRDQETGFDYRGARFYDGDVGRFLSLDPLAETFASISPYNYVLGNPISLIDPSGKSPEGGGYTVYVDGQKAADSEYSMWSRELSIFNQEESFKGALKNALLISAAENADGALGGLPGLSRNDGDETSIAQDYVSHLSTTYRGFAMTDWIIDSEETIISDVEIQIQRWYIVIDQIKIMNRGVSSRFNRITEIGVLKNTTDSHGGHSGLQANIYGPVGDRKIKRGQGRKPLDNPNPGKVVAAIMFFSEENAEHYNAAMNAFSRSFIDRAINETYKRQGDRDKAVNYLKHYNKY